MTHDAVSCKDIYLAALALLGEPATAPVPDPASAPESDNEPTPVTRSASVPESDNELTLVTRSASDSEEASELDPESGATYHLAAFCCECAAIDALYRRQHGMAPAGRYSSVALPMDAPFPLIPRLVPAATAYLASMLVLDTDEELSERLYGRYCDLMATLCTSIPGAGEVIG